MIMTSINLNENKRYSRIWFPDKSIYRQIQKLVKKSFFRSISALYESVYFILWGFREFSSYVFLSQRRFSMNNT